MQFFQEWGKKGILLMECKFENQCPVLLCVYMPTPIVWEIRCYHVHGDLREDRVGELCSKQQGH